MTAAQERRASLVEDLARSAVPGEPMEAVRTRVGAAVDRHGAELIDALLAASRPLSGEDLSWLQDRYLESMVEFGRAACDVMKDQGARHALAQAVQCLILKHEQDVRTVLVAALASDE